MSGTGPGKSTFPPFAYLEKTIQDGTLPAGVV